VILAHPVSRSTRRGFQASRFLPFFTREKNVSHNMFRISLPRPLYLLLCAGRKFAKQKTRRACARKWHAIDAIYIGNSFSTITTDVFMVTSDSMRLRRSQFSAKKTKKKITKSDDSAASGSGRLEVVFPARCVGRATCLPREIKYHEAREAL